MNKDLAKQIVEAAGYKFNSLNERVFTATGRITGTLPDGRAFLPMAGDDAAALEAIRIASALLRDKGFTVTEPEVHDDNDGFGPYYRAFVTDRVH